MSGLADVSGISRRTLTRWETGETLPRLPELDLALNALEASEEERRHALKAIEAPRAVEAVRGMGKWEAAAPGGGDLLKAMRLRKGWTLQEAGRAIGVDHSRISRWERGGDWPSTERLHALCHALGASEAEALTLTTRGGSLHTAITAGAPGVVEIGNRFEEFVAAPVTPETEAVKDLRFLTFEAQCCELAARTDAAVPLLVEVYARHAQYCSSWNRLEEARANSDRALDAGFDARIPPGLLLRAALVSARAAVYRGGRVQPARGLETLRLWQDVKGDPALVAWRQADMARYLALQGNARAAIAVARESCRIAESGPLVEWAVRSVDLAQILLQFDRAEEALSAIPRIPIEDTSLRVNALLTEAEALVAVGETGRAQANLTLVLHHLESHPLDPYRPRAEALARLL